MLRKKRCIIFIVIFLSFSMIACDSDFSKLLDDNESNIRTTIPALPNDKNITFFEFNETLNAALNINVIADISETTITAVVPSGTDISSLSPTILFEGESVSPASNTPTSFIDRTATSFTVTAEDSSTKEYQVTVIIQSTPDESMPGGWNFGDIGSPTTNGSIYYNNVGTYVITGAGDIFGATIDEYYFAYEQYSGDFVVQARIKDTDCSNDDSRVGIMVRENLNPGSKFAFAQLIYDQSGSITKADAEWRTSTGAGSFRWNPDFGTSTPYWFKIERNGGSIIISESSTGDNGSWLVIQSHPEFMPPNVYIGMGIFSNDPGSTCSATIDNYSVSQ